MKSFAGLDEIEIPGDGENAGFQALILYPAEEASQNAVIGPYTFEASPRAKIKPGHHPLVVISHGSGGSNVTHRNLATFLAKHGFVVAMPEHPFNNRSNNEKSDTIENLSQRPRHISQAIDQLLESGSWRHRLDAQNIFAIGHSLGAYTALAVAGGIPHTIHQIENDPTTKITKSQEIEIEQDRRIKGLVLFAPAAGWFRSNGALREVEIPILMYSAELDAITPMLHAQIILHGRSPSTRTVHRIIKNAGHFSFLSPFPERMKNAGLLPAIDPKGFDREIFHDELYAEVLSFLKELLSRKI